MSFPGNLEQVFRTARAVHPNVLVVNAINECVENLSSRCIPIKVSDLGALFPSDGSIRPPLPIITFFLGLAVD